MIEWPAQLVVALAYLDQLERSQALPADQIAAVRKAIGSAETSHLNRGSLAKLQSLARVAERKRRHGQERSRLEAIGSPGENPTATVKVIRRQNLPGQGLHGVVRVRSGPS